MPSWKKILQSGSAVHVTNITASALPNVSQPNIIGYDTASGRFTFFPTSSIAGGTTGTGTQNFITRWSSGTTITTSSIYESGSRIGIGVGSVLPNAVLHISGADNSNLFRVSSPTDQNILFVTGSGRVGIGTGTPTTALDVVGSIKASGYVESTNLFTNLVRGYLTASFGAPGIDFPTTAIVHISGASNSNLLRISSPSATNALFVSGSGNVGIGTTSPSEKLHVVGKARITTIDNGQGDFLTTDANGVITKRTATQTRTDIGAQATLTNPVTGTGTTNYIPKWSNPSTLTDSIIFDDGTAVGIGTAAPTTKLHVSGSFLVESSDVDVKFRFLSESFRNHVITYDTVSGQIFYVTASLIGTLPDCYTPTPIISSFPNTPQCSGSNITLSATNNSGVIGTIEWQWYKDNIAITDATESFFTTQMTSQTSHTFKVLATDSPGGCNNYSPPVTVNTAPHNTITLSSAVGTNNQVIGIGNPITTITYTTTGANGATITGLPAMNPLFAQWSSNVVTISGIPTETGSFTYTVTMDGGCPLGNNTITGSITVVGYFLSGSVTYDNTAQTPMTNTIVQLKDGLGNIIKTADTDATGKYIMYDIPAGAYTLTSVTNKPWGGVTATDALVINRSIVGAAPLVGLRLKAADVNGSNTTTSVDALLVARRANGSISTFAAGNWAYEAIPIQIAGGVNRLQNLKAICVGDVNGSYQPSTSL